jgi:hypothetical protein
VVTGTEPTYIPRVTRQTFRRSLFAAVVLAVLAVAVMIPMGLGLYALFLCVGIGLGALNSGLVVQSVARFARARPSKVRFSGSVLGRLALITVLAFGCALLFRPAGIAVFGGLALFQFLAVASSMLPLIKEIRQR